MVPGNVVDSRTIVWPRADDAAERARGAQQRAELGLAVGGQRRRDADQHRLGVVQVDEARAEAAALERAPAGARRRRPRCASGPRRSSRDLLRVDVDADDVDARLGELHRQRQPDVSQANDPDAHLAPSWWRHDRADHPPAQLAMREPAVLRVGDPLDAADGRADVAVEEGDARQPERAAAADLERAQRDPGRA